MSKRHADAGARVCLRALLLAFLLLELAFSSRIGAQSPTPETGATNFDPAAVPVLQSPPSALAGQSLYLENCAPCHGESGASDGPVVAELPDPPPPLSDPATLQNQSPAEYFYVTKFGRIEKLMPPWGNRLSDEQIWDTVAYAWGLHLSEEAVLQAESLLEEAARESSETLDDIDAFFADTNTLLWSQQKLIRELERQFPQIAATLAPDQLPAVSDYLRAQAIVPPWGARYKEGKGTIEGMVRLIQPDGLPQAEAEEALSVANLPVTLTAYVQFEEVATFQTETDADGSFQFTDLSTQAGTVYLVRTTFQDVDYGTDILELTAANSALTEVELPVYTNTEDPGGIRLNRVNWVIDYAPGEVIVGQILSIGNAGQRAIVGRSVDGLDVPVTVGFELPAGAGRLQFQDGVLGERYHQLNNAIYDTRPIVPGAMTRQIFFSYRLPVEGDAIQFEQSFGYPIDTLNVLIADNPDLRAAVSDLEYRGTESIQNIPYRYWQGTDLPVRTLEVSLSGLIAEGQADPRQPGVQPLLSAAPPGTTAVEPVMEPIMPVLVGGAMLILLAGITLWPISRLLQGPPKAELEDNKQKLIREIARLDDFHAEGKIAEEVWRSERTRYKEQLLDVAVKLEEKA